MIKMKLLLTSLGFTNESIKKALVDLLGKPIDESTALFVPTAIYAYPKASKLCLEFYAERCQFRMGKIWSARINCYTELK